MQPGAVLFSPLFDRKNFAPQGRKLGKLLLNLLQPFMPLAVSDLGLGYIRVSEPILLIQLLNVSDLRAETPYFFSKNFKMIHPNRIAHLVGKGHSNPCTD